MHVGGRGTQGDASRQHDANNNESAAYMRDAGTACHRRRDDERSASPAAVDHGNGNRYSCLADRPTELGVGNLSHKYHGWCKAAIAYSIWVRRYYFHVCLFCQVVQKQSLGEVGK